MSRVSARLAVMNLVLSIAACAPESAPSGIARSVAPPVSGSLDDDPVERCGLDGYITRVIVDPATPQAGDGQHFTRISDAIAAVRAGRITRGEKTLASTACRITIEVTPGTYTGDFAPSSVKEVLPLVLDVPRVTLEGGLRMALDAKGRATGAILDATQNTVLQPTAPLTGTQSLIIVTDSSSAFWGDGVNDTRGDSVTIRGFDLRSGYAMADPNAAGGGFGLFAIRTQGLLVEENSFGFLLASAVDSRASTARLAHNSAIDLGGSCAFCLAGPGSYGVSSNTVARSGIVGVFVVGGTQSPVPAGIRPLVLSSAPAAVASIENNYVTGERQHPVGTAIRIAAIGQGIPTVIGQQTTATVTSNDLVDNRFGLIADGGFPPLNTSTTVASGKVTLTLGGNHFSQSCQADLLVALARHTRALGLPTPQPGNAGYLKQSTYTISLGGDVPWTEVWFSHLATDNGVTLNNALTVDGALVGPGALSAYHGTECGFRPSVRAWIGLKNSDDVGTKFDLLTQIWRNGTLVAQGQLNGVNGGSSGFTNAVERTIGTTLNGAVGVRTGDTLSVTISARIAEGVAGHTSGTARLWYGDNTAASRITTLADTVSRTYYLSGDSLVSGPVTGTRQFVDVLVKKSDGNPFKPFKTWRLRVF